MVFARNDGHPPRGQSRYAPEYVFSFVRAYIHYRTRYSDTRNAYSRASTYLLYSVRTLYTYVRGYIVFVRVFSILLSRMRSENRVDRKWTDGRSAHPRRNDYSSTIYTYVVLYDTRTLKIFSQHSSDCGMRVRTNVIRII